MLGGSLLRRIVAAGVPRVTACDAADAFPAASQEAVLAQSQNRILAAGWMKSAGSTQQRAEEYLVGSHQQYGDRGGQVQDVSDSIHAGT